MSEQNVETNYLNEKQLKVAGSVKKKRTQKIHEKHDQSHTMLKDLRGLPKKKGAGLFNWGTLVDNRMLSIAIAEAEGKTVPIAEAEE